MKKLRSNTIALCAVGSFIGSARAYIPVIDLGIPPGATESIALDITDNGLVLMTASPVGDYLQAPEGSRTFMEPPSGFNGASFYRLNNLGDAAGIARAPALHATVRNSSGNYAHIFETSLSRLRDVNDGGAATGAILGSSAAENQPIYFSPSSGVAVIDLPVGAKGAEGIAIANTGVAVGRAGVGSVQRAFKYTPGVGSELLPTIADRGCEATDINDAGVIVGNIQGRGARWNLDGTVEYIGPPGVNPCTSINSNGDIVGPYGVLSAFVHTSEFGFVDLNSLLSPEDQFFWTINWAWAINDHRQIVGRARYDADGPMGPNQPVNRGFLMNLPEPTLLPAVYAACFGLRRRLPRRAGI